jgi:hypothetical protein
MDYTAKAGAGSIAELTAAMEELDLTAQSELSMVPRLEDSARMWQQAGTWVDEVQQSFTGAVQRMMPSWPAKTDAPMFQERADTSTTSLSQSLSVINGGVQTSLQGLPPVIVQTANDVRARLAEFNAKIAEYNSTPQTLLSGKGGAVSNPAADLENWIPQLQRIVHDAGVALNGLAAQYTAVTPVVTAAGAGVRWVGPRAGSVQAGSGGTANAAAGGAGGASAAGDPGMDAATAAGGAGGDEAGAAAAGGGADGAGADAASAAGAGGAGAGGAGAGGGGAAGDAGSALPSAETGGTGLAGGGVGTLPPAQTAIPGGAPGSNLPGALPGKPNTAIPPGGLPLLPIGGQQVPPAKAATGIGKFTPLPQAATALGGGGGIGGTAGGGGGLGGAGLGDAKSAIKPATPAGTLNQSIPQVAKSVTGATPSTGQAPVLPGGPGNSLAGTSTGQAGTTMPPPMMPPGGLAGAAGGSRAKAGTGAVRPGSPVRQRPTGPTPGIPAGLRGRTKKDEQAGFPTVPPLSNSKKQRRQTEEVETLQLLDEELWEIEQQSPATSPVAGPTPYRRLAH